MRGFLRALPLPIHHQLLWYRITGVLGEGGFGITYAAVDTNLHHHVAIKEYFPRSMCARDTMLDVRVRNDGSIPSYDWGLRRFIDEARTLAHFRHPNIVQVRTAFEKNQTAYMVMDLERGMTLDSAYKAGRFTTEDEILATVGPLLHGLAQVHTAGFIHRDIKLENIILRSDGTPVLVDFGSARQVLGADEGGLTALVTRGYAPFEQYASDDGPLDPGPWCDIYSLAAALYVLITRRMPPDALSRAARLTAGADDPLIRAQSLASAQFSPELLTAVDHGLAFRSDARPRSIEGWLAAQREIWERRLDRLERRGIDLTAGLSRGS